MKHAGFIAIVLLVLFTLPTDVLAQERPMAKQVLTFAVVQSSDLAGLEDPVKRVTISVLESPSSIDQDVHVLISSWERFDSQMSLRQSIHDIESRKVIVTITE